MQTSIKFDTTGITITMSTEHKQKISNALKGKPKSELHKKHMSLSRLGTRLQNDNHFYGKTHTEASKHKISQANKGKNSESNCHLAKRINIFNSVGELQFACYGTFQKTCKENDLPYKALLRSLLNYNSRGIYTKQACRTDKYQKYKGWYTTYEI